MPNVDEAIRILNYVCSTNFSKLSFKEKKTTAESFYSLPDKEKPKSFRKVLISDLLLFFDELNENVLRIVEEHYRLKCSKLVEDSNNNKIGSDLIAWFGNEYQRIELKFGEETNRNIGNNTMDYIFPIKRKGLSFSGVLSILTKSQKKYLLDSVNDIDKGYENLRKLIEEFSNTVVDLYSTNELAVNSKGIEELLSSTGSLEAPIHINNLLKIRVDYSKSLKTSIKIIDKPTLSGPWKITKIGMAENSIRAEIRISNDVISAKFLMNWKNDYKYKGRKYPAKLGLGSTSWNVWIYQ